MADIEIFCDTNININMVDIGCPYARVICEIVIFQTYSKLKLKCRLWRLQSYVRSILGIKIYGVRATHNNTQGVRNRTMKVYLIVSLLYNFIFIFNF